MVYNFLSILIAIYFFFLPNIDQCEPGSVSFLDAFVSQPSKARLSKRYEWLKWDKTPEDIAIRKLDKIHVQQCEFSFEPSLENSSI